MASRGLNPMTVTFMIILVMTTLVFTVLFITASNSLTKTIEGDPEDASRKIPLNDIDKEVRDLRSRSVKAKEDIQIRRNEIERLDVELTKFRVYYVGDTQITGTKGENLTYDNKAYTAKDSPWLLSRDLIAQLNGRMEVNREQLETRAGTIFAAIEDQIDLRSREQQVVLQRANDMDAKFRDDEAKLLALTDELRKRKEQADKQRRVDYGTRASDVNKKEDAIRSLLEIELRWLNELEPDGTIVEVVEANRKVVISLGARDHVFPGLLFDVFQYDKGRFVPKGRVEVIDLQDRIATCRILEESDSRRLPLAPGDYLGNPVFNKDKPPVFVLAGEFKHYNTDDLARFIRAAGGEVREKLEPGCDFLVAGDRSDKIQDIAREYQLIAMKEEQLLRYVQASFSVK